MYVWINLLPCIDDRDVGSPSLASYISLLTRQRLACRRDLHFYPALTVVKPLIETPAQRSRSHNECHNQGDTAIV